MASETTAQKKIKIAVLLPVTGALSIYTEKNVRGVKMAVDDINVAGGIMGQQVEFFVEDTAGNPGQASALVKKVSADKDVLAIIGPGTTGSTVAVGPALEECKIPAISPMSQGDMTFNQWTFRSTWYTPLWVPDLIRIVKQKMDVKTAAMTYAIDDDWSKSQMQWFKKTCEEVGIKLVANEGYRTKDTDFSAQLTKIRAAKPDILIFSGLIKEGSLIVVGARRLGINAKLVGGAGAADPKKWHELTEGLSDGMITATPFWYKSKRPMVKRFVEKYAQQYGGEIPTEHVAFAYDAMILIADSATRAKTTDDRSALRDALGKTKDIELICGEKVSYTDRGDAVKEPTWVIHKNGTFQELE